MQAGISSAVAVRFNRCLFSTGGGFIEQPPHGEHGEQKASVQSAFGGWTCRAP